MSVLMRYEIAITLHFSDHFSPLAALKITFIRNYPQTIKSFFQSNEGLIVIELLCLVLWISLKRFYEERGPIILWTFCMIKTLTETLSQTAPTTFFLRLLIL